ncbi:MAG: calcium/sodium antiporter [Candidatus Magasanikbacteria bacterium]|nr:calcium/sodium antiporter [Candidatus Magasanikbacteria bacterium]
MLLTIFLVIVSLVILIFGGDLLVKGASSLAKRWGIPALVIGLTVVAFGTSMPELVVNVFSALKGATGIAVGNIVGSNISNIFLILGISAIIFPLTVKDSTAWKEIPFAILAGIVLLFMGNDILFDGFNSNILSRTDGLVLLSVFAIFLYYVVNLAKTNKTAPEKIEVLSWTRSFLYLFSGTALLFFGGQLLVDNAVILARIAGMSEMLIGLTIIAIGTSMPELITSAVAAYHNHADIAVGNIIGSNIFNIFWVLGLTSVIKPLPFGGGINFDITVQIIATLLLFLCLLIGTKKKIDRWQGIVFVLLYISYITYLIFRG